MHLDLPDLIARDGQCHGDRPGAGAEFQHAQSFLQLQEAQQAWAKDHGYEYVRCECMNHQREFIHFAVAVGYDIVGIRWDSTHADNLVAARIVPLEPTEISS